MKRDEAVTFLKLLNVYCQSLAPDSISLVNSKPDDPLSVGYQLHIQAVVDIETEKQISALSVQYSLAVHHEIQGTMIIYKPKPPMPP